MARVSLIARNMGFAFALTLCGLGGGNAQAQSQRPQEPTGDNLPEVPDVPDGRRSYAQSAYSKIRAGYSLGGPEILAPPADTRGELAQKRDALVQRHYAHMAELDIISEAALKQKDVSTAERAEALRRRDIQRFMLQMQNLRRQLLKQQAEQGP